MDNASLLVVAMAERCRDVIQRSDETSSLLSPALQREHLLWMCDRIEEHSEDWPATRLHRWIGFIQSAMMANRMLDLEAAKSLFDDAKIAHASTSDDGDLLGHLDPNSTFTLNLGGES